MMSDEIKIPDLLLEQYVLGELGEEKMLGVQTQLQKSPGLRLRLAAIKKSNEDFDLPLNMLRISQHQKQNSVFSLHHIIQSKGFGLAFISCFIVLIANPIFISPLSQISPENQAVYGEQQLTGDVRLKGIGPELQIFRKRGKDIVRLFNEGNVKQSDSLQLSYISAGDGYGVIFSVDGRGELTLHYPGDVSKTTKINSKGLTALSYAYELDDAPDFERFFLITSDHPLNVRAIMTRGRELARDLNAIKGNGLNLNDDIKQTSVLLTKVEK